MSMFGRLSSGAANMSAVISSVAANPPKIVRSKSRLSGFMAAPVPSLTLGVPLAADVHVSGRAVQKGPCPEADCMLFNRLVEAIESHSDDIVTSLVAQI